MKIKTMLHRCRDCESTDLAPKAILCPRCKAAAEEKCKVRKREKAYVLYHAIRKIKKAPKPRPPHPCATSGCDNKIEGKAVFCPSCRHTRQLRHQKNHRDNVNPLNEDLPPAPPTSLKWLENFSGWAQSGMSYAEYQKAGMAGRRVAASACTSTSSKIHLS